MIISKLRQTGNTHTQMAFLENWLKNRKKSMNYNDKYIFISNGEWFKEGTKVFVEDLWRMSSDKSEITYEEMIENPESISGIFSGTRVAQNDSELHPIGEEYEDEELCCLDEFEVKRK